MALGDQLLDLLPDVLSRGLEARGHLHLRAAQAGGDLHAPVALHPRLRHAQRLGDLRLRNSEQPQHALPVLGPPGHRCLEGLGLHRHRPHRVKLARRAGHDHDRGAAGAVGRRHHQARRGTGWVDRRGAVRHHGLLAVGGEHRVAVEVLEALHKRLEDLRDLRLHVGVELERALLEFGHHLAGEVVRGRP